MKSQLILHNGIVQIAIDGEPQAPLSFKSFRPTPRNVSDFGKAGLRFLCVFPSDINSYLGVPYSLFGASWIGDDTYDFATIDAQIDMFLANAPASYLALMIQIDTRQWWLAQNPECPSSFYYLSQAAGCAKWLDDAARYLQAALRHIEGKYGERIYGYFLMGGQTTEWFSGSDYGEPHPIKEAAYRRYTGDDSQTIPAKAIRERTSHGIFRHPVTDAEGLRYWKFHHRLVADTLLYFAAQAQAVLQHQKLVGVYFGYLLELSGERLLNVGHLDYERVFTSPDIDMISSPSAYGHRKHGDASGYMVTLDSLTLHRKLYYLEFDHITHLAPGEAGGMQIPGAPSRFANEQQTIDVMRRDFLLCVTKGAALWWFDMFEGWFYSEGMMREIRDMIRIRDRLAAQSQRSISEIAVFADGESMYYIDKTCDLNTDLLDLQRDGLARMGAPYDLYSLGDIDHPNLPHSQYKLYIFLDTFLLSASQRASMEARVRIAGKAALWLYAPNYIAADGFSLAAMSELTGIQLAELAGTERLIAVGEDTYGFKKEIHPLFSVRDPAATTLGRYTASGETGLAVKDCGGYLSFYSGMGNLPGSVLRRIAARAGVHVYHDGCDPVYINDRLIGVYGAADGEIRLRLPEDMELEELFSGERVTTSQKELCFRTRMGEARLYLRR